MQRYWRRFKQEMEEEVLLLKRTFTIPQPHTFSRASPRPRSQSTVGQPIGGRNEAEKNPKIVRSEKAIHLLLQKGVASCVGLIISVGLYLQHLREQ